MQGGSLCPDSFRLPCCPCCWRVASETESAPREAQPGQVVKRFEGMRLCYATRQYSAIMDIHFFRRRPNIIQKKFHSLPSNYSISAVSTRASTWNSAKQPWHSPRTDAGRLRACQTRDANRPYSNARGPIAPFPW